MSVLPPDVNRDLLELLSNLASSDNSSRSIAEKILEEQWTEPQQVEILLTFLSEQACIGTSDILRSFAAVLFRRIAIKQPKDLVKFTDRNIGVIHEPTRHQIRTTLLNGFLNEDNNQVRHKLSDCIAEVAKEYSSPDKSWDELIPALFEASKSSNPSICESAFRIFGAAPEIIGKQYLTEILPIFNQSFTNQHDDVRIAACTAFVEFFKNLPKNVWGHLSPLLPNLLNSLPMFLQSGQDSSLALVIENLIELVMVAPKMFKDMFPQIIEFCSMISKDHDLDGTTRSAALELLTTFAESSPNMCKRSDSYTNSIVLITLSMLTEVCIDDDDAAEWNNNSNDDDDDEEIEYDAARQSLDRVALRLGGNSLAGPLFQYLPSMLQSPNWRERQAALMALSSAAEGCVDVLINEIPKLLQLILPSINDDHPRVQYACCNALGQMSTDFADVIQRNNGSQVLPALISKLTNHSVPRVQAHAAAALVNFSEAANKDILEPYLDDLLSNLLGLLQSPKKYVQEQVLTTISAIADAAEKKFVKYYDTLMPLLINVLLTDIDDHNKGLLSRCIECSSLIALAVGKEKFENNGNTIIQLYANLQSNLKDQDDEIRQQLDLAWARVCKLVGKEFVQYLPNILPSLLTTAKASQDISILDEEEAEELAASDEWDVIELSGRHIAVHTAALDEKVNAMEILNTYAIELKADFLPWVNQLVNIALPALDFYLHDGVRASAAVTLSSTLRCVVLARGPNSNEALQLWSQICEKLCKTLTNEPVPELLVAYYSCIRTCIELSDNKSLSSIQLTYLADAITSNLTEVYERVKDKDDDDDEYAEDVDEEENEFTDEEILDKINAVISSIFKKTGEEFLNQFNKIYPIIFKLVHEENSNLKICGLLIIIDLLQYCGNAAINFKDQILPILGENLSSSDVSVKQYAATAIGFIATTGSLEYKDFVISSLQPMFNMISIPDAKADENIYATESMISTISLILQKYNNNIPNFDQYLNKWFEYLPITTNELSAKFVYLFVIELINGQHPIIQNNLAKTIDYLLSPISHGILYGNELQSVVAISRQLLSSLPQDQAINILTKYKNSDIIGKYFS